ncbi:uncharacterized protein TRAVEDRAFT_82922, partial [Trametes versicolor FP-101664 SS1]|uniref:uncharacterized protein n=1 Tax=Trametes versicolor (strain FP-101664) TaxID=717944 RepID=UPI0004621E40
VPPFVPLHVVSDSKYVVDGLTRHLVAWERRGWIGVANSALLMETVALLRTRSAPTTFRWVKGHARLHGNEEADRLAGDGANLPPPVRPLFLPAPDRYAVRGASLLYLTQRLAYRGIQMWNSKPVRRATMSNVLAVQSAAESLTGECPNVAAIWTLLRRDPIAKKVRDFLWKVLHGGQRVGKYWSHIPGYEDRATCACCGALDTMEHILCKCSAVGQRVAWALTRGALKRKGIDLPDVTLGIALGGHALVLTDSERKPLCGATRLARLLISETAHLIWVLRCERVIGERPPLQRGAEEDYVENRWMKAVAGRLAMDCALTRVRLATGSALKPAVVEATWTGLLLNEGALAPDW